MSPSINQVSDKFDHFKLSFSFMFSAISCLFILFASPAALFAQKDGKVEMDSARYQLELAKNWSFGWENYKNKQYKDVSRYFWKVIELDTTQRFDRVYRYLGQTYFQLSQPDSAQYVYEEGLKVFPEDATLRRNLAYLYAAREQTEEAISEYVKIRELSEATEDDLNRLANLYVKTDENDKAIDAFEALLELNPDNEQARNTLSQLYRMSGDEDKMLENMEQTLLQNPEDTQTLYALAKSRFDRQEYEEAIELLDRYEKLNSSDIQALELKAHSQQSLGDFRAAIDTYEKIIAQRPKDKRTLVNIGACYRELGQFVTASSYANRALAIDSRFGHARMLMGRIYESAADECSAQKPKRDFSDKLVYEKAYKQYQLAMNDLETRSDAEQRLQYLSSLRPTNEDYFMNKNQKSPKGACYSWIN